MPRARCRRRVLCCRGRPEVVRQVEGARRILMSAIVVGELLYGFRHGARAEHNHAQLDDFLGRSVVRFVPVTRPTTGLVWIRP